MYQGAVAGSAFSLGYAPDRSVDRCRLINPLRSYFPQSSFLDVFAAEH